MARPVSLRTTRSSTFYLIPLFWLVKITNAWCSISYGFNNNFRGLVGFKTRRIISYNSKANADTDTDANGGTGNSNHMRDSSRRSLLKNMASILTTTSIVSSKSASASQYRALNDGNQKYFQQFPTLFAPLYGEATRKTIKRCLGPNIWSLEQNLELGPLQTPIRCVVVQLDNGSLWVHAPLAPTPEFFDLVESCASDGLSDSSNSRTETVTHIVVPTYALEHKVFVRDAIQRWPNAQLWTSPGQFTFPFGVPEEFVFGKKISGILTAAAGEGRISFAGKESEIKTRSIPPWIDEIEYDTLASGTFTIGTSPTTFYETAFFHKKSKSLIVTDSVARIPKTVPSLNDPEKLLLVSKRSTSDPMPNDTPEARLIGWEKTSLLVSYFFPEHEEPDPEKLGVVTWTDGWQDNFDFLSDKLLVVPPVVRTLIYAQNPSRVQEWVDRVCGDDQGQRRWDFEQVIPAHFDAPIPAKPKDFARAFRFLKDDTIDAFPPNDLARGLKPIANLALKK